MYEIVFSNNLKLNWRNDTLVVVRDLCANTRRSKHLHMFTCSYKTVKEFQDERTLAFSPRLLRTLSILETVLYSIFFRRNLNLFSNSLEMKNYFWVVLLTAAIIECNFSSGAPSPQTEDMLETLYKLDRLYSSVARPRYVYLPITYSRYSGA